MKKEEARAILTIKRAGMLTPTGQKEVADWLRQQAKNILKDGKNYSEAIFTARLFFK
jgi:hypothetical protein